MRRVSAALLIVLIAALHAGIPAAAAQQKGWSQPFPVSDAHKTPSSWFPDIAAGPAGSVQIIWSSGLSAKKVEDSVDLLMYRELRGGKWSPVNDIAQPAKGGATVRNSIVIGHDGQLHVAFRQGVRAAFFSAPWKDAWSARAWSDPQLISGGSTYFNALATDSAGTLHVIWNEAVPNDPQDPKPACSFCSDLFYRRSTDGGKSWSRPINLSRSPEGSVKPQIKIDMHDNIHVVWEEGFDWYVTQGAPTAGMYRRSRDGGITWDAAVRFTLPSAEARQPAATPAPQADAPRQMTLGLYQDTTPVVVYRSNITPTIYFQYVDEGGSWTGPAPIPGVRARTIGGADHDDYAMATDGAGDVHLVVTGLLPDDITADGANESLKLLHLVWNGKTWSSPEVIASDQTYPAVENITSSGGRPLRVYPEWPRAVIGGNSLHVTWFTRSERDIFTSDHAHYQVWYTAKPLGGPAVEPLVMFTPIPTIAPTAPPMETPKPAPTALSTAALGAPAIAARPAWEAGGVLTIGVALLPIAGLIGLLVFASLLRASSRRRG
jgi:hypothetical protein